MAHVSWSMTDCSYLNEAERFELLKTAVHQYQKCFNEITFHIKTDSVTCDLEYNFWGKTPKKLQMFLTALEAGQQAALYFNPGSNSEGSIETDGHNITFTLFAAGGDQPCSFSVTVQNKTDVIQIFKELLA